MTGITDIDKPPCDRLVVGYEGGVTGHDALSFADHWAHASGDPIFVVHVRAHEGLDFHRLQRERRAEADATARRRSERLLEQARTLTTAAVQVELVDLEAASAARGLSELLEPEREDGIPLMLLGSQEHRELRRTYPGSTAERLLQGAGASVAVVPWGYSEVPHREFSRIGVGFIDTPDGHAALDWSVRAASHLSVELTVVTVVPDTRIRGYADPSAFREGQREMFGEELRAAVDEASRLLGRPVEGRLLDGPVVDVLSELSLDDLDLLVVGSRGYGPVRRVLLGGVSSRLLRHSRLPVVVAPRAE